jgi:hypothetical protein
MKLHLLALYLFFTCAVCTSGIASVESITATRSTVREWIDVEKAISAEAAEWSEKQMLLQDLLKIAEAEIRTLESSISELAATRTEADEIRRKLLTEQEVLNENHTLVRIFLEAIEPELQAVKQKLPQPLVEKLSPFYQRLPEEPKQTKLGIAKRMQTVVGILTAIRQFDRTITVTDELHVLDNGAQGEGRSVYIGLGVAYYYTLSGKDAGVGYPGNQGWEWESRPSLRSEIEEVIAIAEQSVAEARFIELPISLKN